MKLSDVSKKDEWDNSTIISRRNKRNALEHRYLILNRQLDDMQSNHPDSIRVSQFMLPDAVALSKEWQSMSLHRIRGTLEPYKIAVSKKHKEIYNQAIAIIERMNQVAKQYLSLFSPNNEN